MSEDFEASDGEMKDMEFGSNNAASAHRRGSSGGASSSHAAASGSLESQIAALRQELKSCQSERENDRLNHGKAGCSARRSAAVLCLARCLRARQ